MNKRDEILLRDMLDYAHKATSFLGDVSRDVLESNEVLILALVKAIEIIGEAASRISLETRAALPQVPWKAITGMRNRIVHDYRNIDSRIVWDTVTDDLPALIVELERIVASTPPDAPRQP
jgi:uncharacterized protein with HEPN domain